MKMLFYMCYYKVCCYRAFEAQASLLLESTEPPHKYMCTMEIVCELLSGVAIGTFFFVIIMLKCFYFS